MLSFKTLKEMEMSECLNIKIYKKAKQKQVKEAVKTLNVSKPHFHGKVGWRGLWSWSCEYYSLIYGVQATMETQQDAELSSQVMALE